MNTAASSAADRNRVEIHTVAEVEETTAALGENGMIRLRRKARDVAGEYGLFGIPRDHEDLLSEAFLRLLSGDRSWRKGVDFEPARHRDFVEHRRLAG